MALLPGTPIITKASLAAGCALAAVVIAGCGGGGTSSGSGGGSFFNGVSGSPSAGSSAGAGTGSTGAGTTGPPASATSPAAGGSTSPASPVGPVRLAARLGISPARLKALANQYLEIAHSADRRLDVDNDGYGDAQSDNLTLARRFLLSEVSTEKAFDTELARLAFPPLLKVQAQALVQANNQRISLTERQADATTLAAMRAFDSQHSAADAAVERPGRVIRQDLGLPPAATSLSSPTVL